MFGIVLSALFSALGWLMRSVLIKFALYFGLFFISSEFLSLVISNLLPSSASSGDGGLTSAFSSLTSGMWYFMDLFLVPLGVSSCLAAYVTRFIVRRIPIIG